MNNFLKALRNAKGYEVEWFDPNIITPAYIIATRKKFEMSQNVFAAVIGIGVETLGKWEEGITKVKGPTAALIYLLCQAPVNMNLLFKRNYGKEYK